MQDDLLLNTLLPNIGPHFGLFSTQARLDVTKGGFFQLLGQPELCPNTVPPLPPALESFLLSSPLDCRLLKGGNLVLFVSAPAESSTVPGTQQLHHKCLLSGTELAQSTPAHPNQGPGPSHSRAPQCTAISFFPEFPQCAESVPLTY